MRFARPNRRLLAWAVGVLAFVAVYVSWRVLLVGSVDRLREDLDKQATLVRQMTTISDSLHEMRDAEQIVGQGGEAWTRSHAACLAALREIESEGLADEDLLARARRVAADLEEMQPLREPGSAAGLARPEPTSASLRAAYRRAYEEVRTGISELRVGLTRVSLELAGKWKQVNFLGIVASLMAVALAGMVYALQVALTRSKAAEERERVLEDERNRAARLASMGEMAAGLAHQLNQPLASIHSYLAGCQRRLRESGRNHAEIVEAMQEAQSEAYRASSIVERIRTFVSGQGLSPSLTPVNELVHEARMLVAGDLRSKDIRLSLLLGDRLPLVHADRIHLEQVLVNLLRNAIDAMRSCPPDRRVLTIQTSPADGNEVEVAIADTGGGLTSEEWKHLFEPFHTSKPGGLGLGLAISRRIVEAHGGRIWVEPNRDRGITVRFRLPFAKSGAKA